jgi:hypothetical protein
MLPHPLGLPFRFSGSPRGEVKTDLHAVRPSGTLPFKVRMPSGNRAPHRIPEGDTASGVDLGDLSRLPADGTGDV